MENSNLLTYITRTSDSLDTSSGSVLVIKKIIFLKEKQYFSDDITTDANGKDTYHLVKSAGRYK